MYKQDNVTDILSTVGSKPMDPRYRPSAIAESQEIAHHHNSTFNGWEPRRHGARDVEDETQVTHRTAFPPLPADLEHSKGLPSRASSTKTKIELSSSHWIDELGEFIENRVKAVLDEYDSLPSAEEEDNRKSTLNDQLIELMVCQEAYKENQRCQRDNVSAEDKLKAEEALLIAYTTCMFPVIAPIIACDNSSFLEQKNTESITANHLASEPQSEELSCCTRLWTFFCCGYKSAYEDQTKGFSSIRSLS